MAKDLYTMYTIFFSIAGICFYKWVAIYLKIRNMIQIKCHVTDIRHITTYNEVIHYYHYLFTLKGKEYNICDNVILFKLWPKQINDELDMYVDKNNPSNVVTPWQTYLYKIYLYITIISILIPLFLSL